MGPIREGVKEFESRIVSTRGVGPRTIACDGPRSVFDFYTFAVVCDMLASVSDARKGPRMLSRSVY